jgi:hypothetical protein
MRHRGGRHGAPRAIGNEKGCRRTVRLWQWNASIKVDSQADSPAHPASIMPPRPWLTNALERSQE